MRAGFLSWIRGEQGAREKVSSQTAPSLEALEPRLLLNADFVGVEPLRTLDVQPCEQIILVDLDQQTERIQETDPSLILTYLASPEGPKEAVAPQGQGEDDEGPLLDSLGVLGDSVVEVSTPSESLAQGEFGSEIAIDSKELATLSYEQSACLIPVDRQDDVSGTEDLPIEARGPPAAANDALNALCATTYGEESQPYAVAEMETVSTQNGTKVPELPGLILVDPDISNWQDQTVYLDFDGEENLIYNGPVTVGPFDVPAFRAPSDLTGQEQAIINEILLTLQDIFATSGVIFTSARPVAGTEYSRIYIGGDDSAFSTYGSFLGLAEQVDEGNQDREDVGLVFSRHAAGTSVEAYAATLAEVVTHEAGHLLGYSHGSPISFSRQETLLTAVATTATSEETKPGITASSWNNSDPDTDEFRKSQTYQGGIQLGGYGIPWENEEDLIALPEFIQSQPTYTFALPQAQGNIQLQSLKVTIYGNGDSLGVWGLPVVKIGTYTENNVLARDEGACVREYAGAPALARLRNDPDGIISYVDVTIDATSGYYDLRDISLEATYSGLDDDQLSTVNHVVSGKVTLDRFLNLHKAFWNAEAMVNSIVVREILRVLSAQFQGVVKDSLPQIVQFAWDVYDVYVRLNQEQIFAPGWLHHIYEASVVGSMQTGPASTVATDTTNAIQSLRNLLETYIDDEVGVLQDGTLSGSGDADKVNPKVTAAVTSLTKLLGLQAGIEGGPSGLLGLIHYMNLKGYYTAIPIPTNKAISDMLLVYRRIAATLAQVNLSGYNETAGNLDQLYEVETFIPGDSYICGLTETLKSFTLVVPPPPPPPGACVPQVLPYTQTFDEGKPTAGQGWEYYSTNDGRIQVVDGRLRMDDGANTDIYSLNEAILHLNLTGQTEIKLTFEHYNPGDEPHSLPVQPFTDHYNGDGVAISNDGITWTRISALTSTGTVTLSPDLVNIFGEGADLSNVRIKFQQYDNAAYSTDGREFDNLRIADYAAPEPNPSMWAMEPYSTWTGSIRMVATTASDPSGVEYYFDETSGNPGGTDSGWQNSNMYEDTGLSPNTTYTYRVRTRDKSADENTGGYSSSRSVTTDTAPPMPNPSTWSTAPYATGPYSILMTATTANDPSGVEYYFDETSGNPGGSDSGWQASPTYEDTGLSPNTTYTYSVGTRDTSSNWNAGFYSSSLSATTAALLYTATAYGDWANWIGEGPGESLPENPYSVFNGPAQICGSVGDTGWKSVEVVMENSGDEPGLVGSISLYGQDGEWDIPDLWPQESCGQAWGKIIGRFTPSAYPAGTPVVLDLSLVITGNAGDAEDYYFRIFRDGSIIGEILSGDTNASVTVVAGEELTYEMYAMADDFEPNAWQTSYDRTFTFTCEEVPVGAAIAYGEWADIITDGWEPVTESPYVVYDGPARIHGSVADTGFQSVEVGLDDPDGEAALSGSIWLYGQDGEWDMPDEYPQESCGLAWGRLTGTFTPSAYPAGTTVVLDLSVVVTGDFVGDAEDYYFRILQGGSVLAEILPGDTNRSVIVIAGEELTYAMYAMADDFEPNAWQTSYDRVYEFTLLVGNAAGTISGGIWADIDHDGTWDKTAIDGGVREPGIEGWTVYLDRDNDGTWDDSTTTGEDGSYEFVELPAGVYAVAAEVRGGWVQVYPAGDGRRVVNLEVGATETGVNFGNLPPNLLYVDDDAPGDPSPGNPSVGDLLENGSRSHPYDSVQEAIRYVALDGQVRVAAGRYTEVLTIDRRVSLYGGYNGANWDVPQDPDDNVTIIDALGWGQSVVSVRNAELIVDGFALTNGVALHGGGMYCDNSLVWVYRCNIIGNSTMDGGAVIEDWGSNGGDGGGIYCIASTLTVQESMISDNRTGRGMDQYGGRGGNGAGICAVESDVVMVSCTVAGNTTGPGGTGDGDSAWSGGSGGGLYADSSVVTMTDCTIENNATGTGGESQGGWAGQGGHGGGVYAISSTLEVNGGTIRENATGSGGDCQGYTYLGLGGTGGFGGALHLESSTFTGTAVLFESNSTGMGGYTTLGRGAPGGDGGALYSSSSTVQLIECTLIGNSTGRAGPANWPSRSGSGGALYLATCSVDISDCVIEQNRTGSGLYCGGEESGSSGGGGGIYLSSCHFAFIRNCRIIGNATGHAEAGFIYAGGAGHGGGLSILGAGSATHIENCLIAGNSAGDGAWAEHASSGGSGGGVYCGVSSTVTIVGCTIVGNSHGNKGVGVYEDGVDGQGGGVYGNGSTSVINSIIWANLKRDLSGCSVSNVSYCNVSDVVYDGINHNISIDPRFVNPSEGDYRLHVDSPCIDQGSNVAVSPMAVTDLDGNPRIGGMTVDLGAYESLRSPFRILDVETFPWGFVAHFNHQIDTSVLNLYDTATAGYGHADVTVIGQTVGPVSGSLILSADHMTIHFIKTGSFLEADTYTLTFRSAANAFQDVEGHLLDGDDDQIDGGDYVTTMVLNATGGRWLSIPDFCRGPGQAVDVPATGAGIPIILSNGTGVQAVDFVLEYVPVLLTITGVSLGAGLPVDWSISYNLNTPGHVSVTVYGATALAAGQQTLAVLEARIPADAPYSSAGLVELSDVTINEGAIESRADSGIEVVAYLGDATGNHAYSGLDASYIARVSVGLDSGFAKYRMKDPVLIGDVTGNGKLSGLDASYVARKVVGLAQPQIPDLPGVLPPIVTGGIDPLLSVGCERTAEAGETITLEILVDDAAGVLAADIVLGYDTAVFDLNAGGLSKGALTSGWTLVGNVDDATGQVRMTLFGVNPLSGGSGSLAKIIATVRGDAPAGVATLDLTEASALNEGELVLTLQDGQIEILPEDEPATMINDRVSIAQGSMLFDRRTGLASVELTIRNMSAVAITGPIRLAIGGISDPGVSVAAADGMTKSGLPYIDLSNRLGDGVFSSGEVVKVRVYFNNPLRKRFVFQPLVFAVLGTGA